MSISPHTWKERAVGTNEDHHPAGKKPLSARVQLEMYAGKRQGQKIRHVATMPAVDYDKFCKWVNDWATQVK
jgi:hypothetical protein